MEKKILFVILAIFLFMNIYSVSALTSISYFFNNSIENKQVYSSSSLITSSWALINILTEKKSLCKYSSVSGINYDLMEGNFDFNSENIHKENLVDLTEGSHLIFIRCRDENGTDSNELEFRFNVNIPVYAQISFNKDKPLNSGLVEVKLTSSKVLSDVPTLSYSFDGSDYDPIPLSGSGTTYIGYINILSSIGEGVGSFKFSGRDLEGVIGTEIRSGNLFLVDTIKPREIIDISIIGGDGYIDLKWYNDDEVKQYNIYRSLNPGVSQTNYYKSVSDEILKDSNLERGKTYYYKISAIDKAGNEGELSREVSATVLLNDYKISESGLSSELLSYVDNKLFEIDGIISNINSFKSNFNSRNDIEKKVYGYLKLESDLLNSQKELESLRSEISRYKDQSLSKSELDKKLSSADLKINSIMKKIPENFIISSQKSVGGEILSSDITQLLLEANPEYDEEKINRIVEKSMEIIEDYQINIDRTAYNLEVNYLDGSKKSISLVKEEILGENDENLSYYESIPKGIVESLSEVDIKNVNYNIIKEDTIIRFNFDEKEIIYSINKNIDLNSIGQIKTIPIYKIEDKEEKRNLFTGYATYFDFKNNSYLSYVIFAVFMLLAGSYLFISRKNANSLRNISEVVKLISMIKKSIESDNFENAKNNYKEAALIYSRLSKKDRENIYSKLDDVYQELNLGYFEKIESILKYQNGNNSNLHLKDVLISCYNNLNDANKEKKKESYNLLIKEGKNEN